MDERNFTRYILTMTELFGPTVFKEFIDSLPNPLCDLCFKNPIDKQLTKCFFCKMFFCNLCCGKKDTQICCKCNYVLAANINEDILKQYSVSEMRAITKNYKIPLDYVFEKEQLIEAILINFKKSIKSSGEIVEVSELKKKMDDLQAEESLQREKNRLDNENRLKIFADYSQTTNENIRVCVKFTSKDSIDLDEKEIPNLPIRKLKELLDRFNIDYTGIIEKNELVLLAISLRQEFEKFKNSHKNDSAETRSPIKLYCNLCQVSGISCVFLFCGHAMCCFQCGSKLSSCPKCHSDIKQCFRIIIG